MLRTDTFLVNGHKSKFKTNLKQFDEIGRELLEIVTFTTYKQQSI